jgi:ubiquinone/menaquinone biosynthesis C-methylase UbiE
MKSLIQTGRLVLSRRSAAKRRWRTWAPIITWLEGDSSQVATLGGPGADLAAFAASFHWTDRPAVLAALDGVLTPGGTVVIINDILGDSEKPGWVHAIARIRARYLGARPRARGQRLGRPP